MIDDIKNILDGIMYYSELWKSIGALGTMFAAVLAFIKYRSEKNRELYLKRLNEVYAPLYLYLCKQEIAREIFAKFNESFKEIYTKKSAPIFELAGKTHVLITPKEFLDIAYSVDKSLMTPKLINLLGAYNAIDYMFDESTEERKVYFKEKQDAVQRKIVEEIIIGYKKCIKKIDMDDINQVKEFIDFEIDNI